MDLYKSIYTEVAEGRRGVDNGDNTGVVSEDDCPRCSRAVTDADPAVKCDSCQCWHHAACEGISPEEYGRMMSECQERPWFCGDCTIIPDTGVGDSRSHVQLKWAKFYRSGSDVLGASRETLKAHLYKSFSQELEAWVRPDTFEVLSKISKRFSDLLKTDSFKELVRQGVFRFHREGWFELETTATDSVTANANLDLGGTPSAAPNPPTIPPHIPTPPHENSANIVVATSRIGEIAYFERLISFF